MAKNWWFKFEWERWLNDEDLLSCSLETQGFWVKCIAMMHRAGVSEFTGSIDQLRRKFGILPAELTRCLRDLQNNKAADVRFGNGEVSVKSRSIEKELKAKEQNRLYVAKHREKGECKDDVRQQSKSKSKSKSKNKKATPADAGTLDSIFDEFRVMLQNAGTNEKSARSKIGGLVKTHGKPKVTAAFNANKDAIAASIEPYAYFCKILKSFVYEDDLTKKIKNAKRYHHDIYGGLEYDVPFKPERYNITQEEYARYCAAN